MNFAPKVPLGDILTLQRGFDITKAEQRNGDVPVVSSSGIQSYHDRAMVNRPGVVIGRKGSLGTCFYLDQPHWPHDTTLWVKDFKGNDPRFCFYLLQMLDLKQHDVGAANPTLNRNHVHLLSAPSHPLPIQKRISCILGAYDDLIDVNRRRVTLLEELARGLFEEWFVRFRFAGYETVTIRETPEGPLPEGWRWGTLSDVVELRRDRTRPGDHLSSRVYVPIECIGRKTLALPDVRPWQEAQSSLQTFERGDILFGAMRAYFHKVCPAPMPGITRTTVFVLKPRNQELFSFATWLLARPETVAYAAAHSAGSTIPYAQWDNSLERMAIRLPPLAIVEQFDRLVRPMLEFIMAFCRSQQLLAEQRDLLLPRLLSGQLTLAEAEEQATDAALISELLAAE